MRCPRSVSILTLLLGVRLVLSKGFSIPATRRQSGHSHRQSNHRVSTELVVGADSPTFPMNTLPMISTRGGAGAGSAVTSSTTLRAAGTDDSKCPVSGKLAVFGSLWGTLGVVYILAKAIKRVMPIALEPFQAGSTLVFGPTQWCFYALSCLFFAYVEGYKGFQKKFSPLVVKRSFTLVIGTTQGSVRNYVLAPLYSMGLIHATRKRMITSWCVSLGVAAIVAGVKRLPGVWRCILDAGVVVGLSWGSLSILFLFLQSWRTGKAPAVDACLPEEDDNNNNNNNNKKPK